MNSETQTPTHRVPSLLGRMILTRMIANRTSPSRADFVKDLKPLFPASLRGSDSDWKQLVYRTLEELAESGHITDATRSIRITESGRDELRRFLNVESLPEHKPWGTLKKAHLVPLALGAQPANKTEAANAASSDGFKAALLVKLFGLNLNAYPTLPQAIHALVAQQDVKAQRNHPDAFRDALLQHWVSGLDADSVYSERTTPEPSIVSDAAAAPTEATIGPEQGLTEFAATVKRIARSLKSQARGEKVLISRIWNQFQTAPGGSEMSRERFNEQLLESNREQLLTLSRADLLESLDPSEHRDSEVCPEFGDRFHFVRTDRD